MKILKEFKEFISKGNVLDMAVGVIIGGAFTAIVNSLVNDIFMPLLGLLTGGMNFAGLSLRLGGNDGDALQYGAFIAAVINFLLIALVLFLVIKAINRLRNLKKAEPDKPAPAVKACPYCKSEIALEASRCPHCTSVLEEG
ncbi:large conductance mechanosensitive channel protein MscL [Neglecta sp. X4]|nr:MULTISPECIES: large conductance mechanosensitive channel protein MscL [unclassified Neglectibacter]NBI16370.1 large conductance mechanosensitive channel protein MscL [Neglectibacter sp. 59]NBJ72068.1 large conductance mechanosensitive channel protein MscL [Neglectibacter sp. X4]NCE79844.1 large conductance mechanosensitive channel protein MscL [Neglectibacter sp. X58]